MIDTSIPENKSDLMVAFLRTEVLNFWIQVFLFLILFIDISLPDQITKQLQSHGQTAIHVFG